MLEGEEKEQEIGNLFEKIVKENLRNLVKEIDMQVQEAQRVPNKMDAKRPTPRHTIIKMPKVKDTESNLYLTHRNKHREAAKMRQRNMVQMKEQIKTPEKELNEKEISNLSDAEFKTGYKDAQGT